MRWFNKLRSHNHVSKRATRKQKRALMTETLESRELFAADPLPVLLVIADQQDFYYREYAETRQAIESKGVDVVVAATTTNTSYPHAGTGQGASLGAVTPDIALADVDPSAYSAIAFVGGWGASMYQYAYNDPDGNGVTDNYYSNPHYNGDANLNDGAIAPQKLVVNQLIGQFMSADKPVAAICHGVTVLAWARVDGASPIAGRHVAVPKTVSSPDQFYNGAWHNNGYYMGQYEQVIANGAIASPVSGAIGNPNTVADDVVVDGNIITAENFDSSYQFGLKIASEVIDNLVIEVLPPVQTVGNDIIVRGTDDADTIYIWSQGANQVGVWINGVSHGAASLGPGGRVIVFGGAGNDSIFATDLYRPATIYGEAGHDLVTGGFANDILDGGEGVDRLWGGPGDDLIRGGGGNDYLFGREGNNVILGGDGDDYLEGLEGRDVLIGGLGSDFARGNGGDDLLIGGTTSFDQNDEALLALLALWNSEQSTPERIAALTGATIPPSLSQFGPLIVHDDLQVDKLFGNAGDDWYFAV